MQLDCHRQYNPIVIDMRTRFSSPVNPIVIAIRTQLSSPVQPYCYRYENQIVIASTLSSPPIQCTLHLLQPSGVVRGGQTRVSILVGFKFRMLFLLAANEMGVYEAPSVSHMVRSCTVLTAFVS